MSSRVIREIFCYSVTAFMIDVPHIQLKEVYRRTYRNRLVEFLEERNNEMMFFRQTIKYCDITEKEFDLFRKELINKWGNKCERCGIILDNQANVLFILE